jgi:glycosyltransferase involved in cell wall biosynthesis
VQGRFASKEVKRVSESYPRVTIGVPVFNGESFVAAALDSLLNQTFTDFEIVISDNASTDRTEQICRDYAARDPRIRYYRSDVNRGAAWNHNRVFDLARGEYFKWNSADDLCAPEFLARCVAALDQDSSGIMACSKVLVIDDEGNAINPGLIPEEVASPSAFERFRRNIQTDHPCFHIYSLIRSRALHQTGPLGGYSDGDRVLLSHLSLLGRCVLIPDALLFNRDHRGRFSRSYRVRSPEGTAWFDSNAVAQKSYPHWREFQGLGGTISRCPLAWRIRMRCYWAMIRWLHSHKGLLLQDLLHYPKARLARYFGKPKAAARPSVTITPSNANAIGSTSVTVILCTYNRCQDLTGALESIARSQMPNSVAWEVLVVDNNSTDGTRAVVEDFCRRYPGRFRYLFEPRPGKSYALNAGIDSATGEILAFVDDDVTVEPRWLRNLTGDLQSGEWAGAGGRILPASAFTPPRWFSWEHCAGTLCAYFDMGDQAGELDLDHLPYGANMAFRKDAFKKYGGFRLDLGPRPHSQLRSEDVELARRLLKAGERLRYEPLAVVYHPVPQGRIEKTFFLSWWFDFGRASIIERDEHPDVCGIPWDVLSLMRRCLHMSAMALRWTFARTSRMRFFWRCMLWKQAGMITELSRRLFDGKVAEATVRRGSEI